MLKDLLLKLKTGFVNIITLKAFRQKKLTRLQLIILGIIVVVLAVIGLTFKMRSDRLREEEAARLAQEKKEEELIELMSPSDTPLSPEEILEREKKLAGEDVVTMLDQAKEAREKQDALQKEIEDAGRRKAGVTKQDIMVVADEGLPDLLLELLPEGDPGLIYKALSEMRQRGLNAVRVLRNAIVDNPQDPLIRKNALIALFYIGGEEVTFYFKASARTDPDEKVRLVALFCLDFLTGKEEQPFFEESMNNDPSPAVREKAREYWEFRSQE